MSVPMGLRPAKAHENDILDLHFRPCAPFERAHTSRQRTAGRMRHPGFSTLRSPDGTPSPQMAEGITLSRRLALPFGHRGIPVPTRVAEKRQELSPRGIRHSDWRTTKDPCSWLTLQLPRFFASLRESHVIPAKAGIQFLPDMDPRFRGGDVLTFISMGGPLAHGGRHRNRCRRGPRIRVD